MTGQSLPLVAQFLTSFKVELCRVRFQEICIFHDQNNCDIYDTTLLFKGGGGDGIKAKSQTVVPNGGFQVL